MTKTTIPTHDPSTGETIEPLYEYKIVYSREVIIMGRNEAEAKAEFKDDYIFDEIISIKKLGD
jgi:hypothetical protein